MRVDREDKTKIGARRRPRGSDAAFAQFLRSPDFYAANPTQPKFLVSPRKPTKIHASEDVQHDISKFQQKHNISTTVVN